MSFVRGAFSCGNPRRSWSILNSHEWFFSVTPFPKERKSLMTASKDTLTNLLTNPPESPVDILMLQEDARFDRPILLAKNCTIFFELTERTSVALLDTFLSFLASMAKMKPCIYTTVIFYGSTLRFPVIGPSGKRFRMTCWSDIDEPVSVDSTSMYFSLATQSELFLSFIEAARTLKPEYPRLSPARVLACCCEPLKDYRQQAVIVTWDAPISEPTILTRLSQTFFDVSVNTEFFCVGTNQHPDLLPFVNAVNGSITNYGEAELDILVMAISRSMLRPRVRQACMDILCSSSIDFVMFAGRGKNPGKHAYQVSKLSDNDTIHLSIVTKPKKFEEDPPKAVLMVTYVDAVCSIYTRVISIDCSSRLTDPVEILAAVAVKVALGKIDPNVAVKELSSIDLDGKDWVLRERFKIALGAIGYIKESSSLANFVLGSTPEEVMQRMSPLCVEFGTDQWKPLSYVQFGVTTVFVELPRNTGIVILRDGESLSYEEMREWVRLFNPQCAFAGVHQHETDKSVMLTELKEIIHRIPR